MRGRCDPPETLLSRYRGADRRRSRLSGGVNVVVVEDEAKIAAFVARGLEAHGFNVLVAGDGPSGLRLALDPEVDLVVLDLILPGLDGTEVLTRLREHRPQVPV